MPQNTNYANVYRELFPDAEVPSDIVERMEYAMDFPSDERRDIFCMFYGLGDYDAPTGYDAIRRKYHLSRNQIVHILDMDRKWLLFDSSKETLLYGIHEGDYTAEELNCIGLSHLDMSVRAMNILMRSGCRTIGEAAGMSSESLRNLPNSTPKIADEIQQSIERFFRENHIEPEDGKS